MKKEARGKKQEIRPNREVEIVKICKKVLIRLSKMDYEYKNPDRKFKIDDATEQLIFPQKVQKKEKKLDRISEQELRLLFIEEFKKEHTELFYSIETPTEAKYKFGNKIKYIKIDKNGQSALTDMCVFERENNHYTRILNIEFHFYPKVFNNKNLLNVKCYKY